MWWQENALDQHGEHAASTRQSRAEHQAGAAAHADTRPRADHAHCAFGLPFYATRTDRAPPGLTVNWRERRDMPWILLLAAVVVLIVIIGVWN